MNMVHLEASKIAATRGLFAGAHIELVVDGVIAGNSPGRVWADDRSNRERPCCGMGSIVSTWAAARTRTPSGR